MFTIMLWERFRHFSKGCLFPIDDMHALPSLAVNNMNRHQHNPNTQVFTIYKGQTILMGYINEFLQCVVIIPGQETLVLINWVPSISLRSL